MASNPLPLPTLPQIPNIHGPYEDLGIAAFAVLEKLIDGQTKDQQAQMWAQWIQFWSPLMSLLAPKVVAK